MKFPDNDPMFYFWEMVCKNYNTKKIMSVLIECCFVNSGGAAITWKNELEKINEENLLTVCSQLRIAMMSGSSSDKVLSLDWSKRHGGSDTVSVAEDFTNQLVSESNNFVVVHGAGQ